MRSIPQGRHSKRARALVAALGCVIGAMWIVMQLLASSADVIDIPNAHSRPLVVHDCVAAEMLDTVVVRSIFNLQHGFVCDTTIGVNCNEFFPWKTAHEGHILSMMEHFVTAAAANAGNVGDRISFVEIGARDFGLAAVGVATSLGPRGVRAAFVSQFGRARMLAEASLCLNRKRAGDILVTEATVADLLTKRRSTSRTPLPLVVKITAPDNVNDVIDVLFGDDKRNEAAKPRFVAVDGKLGSGLQEAVTRMMSLGYTAFLAQTQRYAVIPADLEAFIADVKQNPHGLVVWVASDMLHAFYNTPNVPFTIPMAPQDLEQCMDQALPKPRLVGLVLEPSIRCACTMDSDAVCTAIRVHGHWEGHVFAAVKFALDSLKKDGHNPFFIDFGANVGAVALRIAAAGYDVFGFEVMPRNMQMLVTSKCLNSFKNLWLHQYALGDGMSGTRECRIVSPKESNDAILDCSNKSLEEIAPYEVVEGGESVAVRRFDDVASTTGIGQLLAAGGTPIVKIDVEGSEVSLLRGAVSLLDHPNRPPLVLSEIWKSLNFTDFAALMMPRGYVAYLYAPRKWLLTMESAVKYHISDGRPTIDTVAWVQKSFAYDTFSRTPHQGHSIVRPVALSPKMMECELFAHRLGGYDALEAITIPPITYSNSALQAPLLTLYCPKGTPAVCSRVQRRDLRGFQRLIDILHHCASVIASVEKRQAVVVEVGLRAFGLVSLDFARRAHHVNVHIAEPSVAGRVAFNVTRCLADVMESHVAVHALHVDVGQPRRNASGEPEMMSFYTYWQKVVGVTVNTEATAAIVLINTRVGDAKRFAASTQQTFSASPDSAPRFLFVRTGPRLDLEELSRPLFRAHMVMFSFTTRQWYNDERSLASQYHIARSAVEAMDSIGQEDETDLDGDFVVFVNRDLASPFAAAPNQDVDLPMPQL